MHTLSIFCANEQAETEHTVVVNDKDTSELICTCSCGRAVKFPNVSKAKLEKHIEAHRAANFSEVPIVSAEEFQASLKPKYL